MPKKKEASLLDREEVLARNEMINVDTVAAHEKLGQDLRKLGVEIKPSLNLEQPLGRNRTALHNWSK